MCIVYLNNIIEQITMQNEHKIVMLVPLTQVVEIFGLSINRIRRVHF